MPDLSKYEGLNRICTAEKWEDQKECILKRVEKSAYRGCCMWFWKGVGMCKNPDKLQGLDYQKLVVPLINAVKQLKKEIEELKKCLPTPLVQ